MRLYFCWWTKLLRKDWSQQGRFVSNYCAVSVVLDDSKRFQRQQTPIAKGKYACDMGAKAASIITL
jgi:hypothetical protein